MKTKKNQTPVKAIHVVLLVLAITACITIGEYFVTGEARTSHVLAWSAIFLLMFARLLFREFKIVKKKPERKPRKAPSRPAMGKSVNTIIENAFDNRNKKRETSKPGESHG